MKLSQRNKIMDNTPKEEFHAKQLARIQDANEELKKHRDINNGIQTNTYTAVHSRVLIVARQRAEGAWKAYVTPVPGVNHLEEVGLWQVVGAQMLEKHARPFFPQFKDIPYAK